LQLFEDYHIFKRPELKHRSAKTPEASQIDRKLALDSMVRIYCIFSGRNSPGYESCL